MTPLLSLEGPRRPDPPGPGRPGPPGFQGLSRRLGTDPAVAIQPICRPADEPGMLLCKSCNTRFEDGKSACPSCGRRIFVSIKEAPKQSAGDSGPTSLPAAAATAGDPVDPPNELSGNELDLGEVDVLAEAALPEAVEELKSEVPAKPRARARRLEPEAGPAGFHLSAAPGRTLAV